jgi:hypothetical protein
MLQALTAPPFHARNTPTAPRCHQQRSNLSPRLGNSPPSALPVSLSSTAIKPISAPSVPSTSAPQRHQQRPSHSCCHQQRSTPAPRLNNSAPSVSNTVLLLAAASVSRPLPLQLPNATQRRPSYSYSLPSTASNTSPTSRQIPSLHLQHDLATRCHQIRLRCCIQLLATINGEPRKLHIPTDSLPPSPTRSRYSLSSNPPSVLHVFPFPSCRHPHLPVLQTSSPTTAKHTGLNTSQPSPIAALAAFCHATLPWLRSYQQ